MIERLLLDILNSREERAYKQLNILKDYHNSLVSFTLNIPGAVKDSDIYRKIHKEGLKEILKRLYSANLEEKYLEEINKITGPEAYISVDIDSTQLKRWMVGIENHHPLGRIFDIDVFDPDHKQVSRSSLGLESRGCLICDKDARICMREESHSYEALVFEIEKLSQQYFR